ncbi:MAG: hypothetical protein ACQEP7_00850 [bacterium]
MIGMSFISFLILLAISVVVALIFHFGGYNIRSGWDSFVNKVIIGWVGAWLGTPVIGYWPDRFDWLSYSDANVTICIIPAIIGAFALVIFAVDIARTCKEIHSGE